ncbi:MAG: PTS sugar transporter subunit IIA [Leptospiraceae bacterium]|nr:PTS sugar transporter subunit IIA [Leptospiraceae bacterium]MCP5503294.1 PTS sugar transporter subunit IIA [Leptospiraceae bacterium]
MKTLLELIQEKDVIYDLKAEDPHGLIRKLVEHCRKNGTLNAEQSQEITTALINRENTMSTGIGGGIAIPHCSAQSIQSEITLLAISKEGIEFNAIDKAPVHIFVMLVVPRDRFQDHIKTLALIAKTLNQKEERDRLIEAQNFQDIQSILNFGVR